MNLSRPIILYAFLSLLAAFVIVFYFSAQPGYTDAFYHYNAAVHVAQGEGFVDDYLWMYIGAPDSLPAPSHLYWMPGTTLVASLGMFLFGANYRAAQIGLALCLWGAGLVAYGLGRRFGTARHAWQAAIIVLFGGFFMRFWGQTDTFAPYAFFGSLTLACIGLSMVSEKHNLKWWVLAGVFAACSHLIRTDGLILLLVGWGVLFWPFDFIRAYPSLNPSPYMERDFNSAEGRITPPLRQPSAGERGPGGEVKQPQSSTLITRKRLVWFIVFTLAYLVAMSPWFVRNLNAIGTVLPVGGTQGAWYTQYDDLYNYPPDASPQTLFANGGSIFIAARLQAVFGGQGALMHFFSEQAMIVLTPFILIGLWVRRRDVFLRPVWIFALGIHLAFALVFPFPGMRGGLWHASAALLPFWAVLGLLGLDDAVDWLAKYRRKWNVHTAKPLFSAYMVLLIVGLSFYLALPRRFERYNPMPHFYQVLSETMPDRARVMINDPAQLYYYTGLGGVVIPNESPETTLAIARLYNVDYLVLEPGGIPAPMLFGDDVPDFLTPLDVDLGEAKLYAIERD